MDPVSQRLHEERAWDIARREATTVFNLCGDAGRFFQTLTRAFHEAYMEVPLSQEHVSTIHEWFYGNGQLVEAEQPIQSNLN